MTNSGFHDLGVIIMNGFSVSFRVLNTSINLIYCLLKNDESKKRA